MAMVNGIPKAPNHKYIFSKSRRKRKAVTFACFLCLSIAFFLSNLPAIVTIITSDDNTAQLNALPLKQDDTLNTHTQSRHCVVHVHGLHHTGTGFTRQVLFDSLEDASIHHNTRVTQDEGQHLQSVYPTFRKRLKTPHLCATTRQDLSTTLHRLYSCIELQEVFAHNRTTASQRLHQQWARYWDSSKFYWIQKTPTMDIGLLETLKLYPTVHVVVMRHPQSWTKVLKMLNPKLASKLEENPLSIPQTWWNVWTTVLEILSQARIKSFVVVNYEELLSNKEVVSRQLSEYIQSECNLGVRQQQSKTRRRLHLYTNTSDISSFLAPKTAIDAYEKCRNDDACNRFMNTTASTLREFGYNWNPFNQMNGDSKLLYTSHKRPSTELVKRMKQVGDIES